MTGPIGGSGGTGGDVILQADPSFNTLFRFKGSASYKGENGFPGECNFQNGRYGADCVIHVPPGTVVRDAITFELVGELKSDTERLVVAKGGLGGQGNAANKAPRGGRFICSPPQGGQRKQLKLELKLVADIGLVGVPNAGKSTLLNAITNARPKIASYPFTTIVPNLGVCDLSRQLGSSEIAYEKFKGVEGQTMVVADIPGLLEGAHRGVGLGRGFLRHIERCKMIIHVINGDSADPIGEFNAINRELNLFSPTLAAKPQVVVLNKIDLPGVAEKEKRLQEALLSAMAHTRLVCISAAERLHVPTLLYKSWQFLKKLERDEREANGEPVVEREVVLAPDDETEQEMV